jgi:PKD repeat protein
MLSRLFFLKLFFIGACLSGYAQTVSIQSPSEVCLNDVITFEPVITGTASGYSWAFGDNSTSTQRITSHTYSTAGSVTVTLTVTFGGTTQSATKTVIVHDLPIADFTLDGSNFCFLNQDVCLTDKSTMGSTTSGYATRKVVWGDGRHENTKKLMPEGTYFWVLDYGYNCERDDRLAEGQVELIRD